MATISTRSVLTIAGAGVVSSVAAAIVARAGLQRERGRRRESALRHTIDALRHRDAQATENAASLALRNQELAHRYTNFLAVVQVVADRTLAQASDLVAARRALSERICALGATTAILTMHECSAAPLDAVVRAIVRPHDADGTRILCSGPPILLPPRMVLGMALMLHELTTNAVKYGALSVQNGRVELRWTVQRIPPRGGASEGVETLHLSWREHGGPPVTPPTRSGFGTTLIEKAATAYFRGRGELAFVPEGVVFEFEAPLPAIPQFASTRLG